MELSEGTASVWGEYDQAAFATTPEAWFFWSKAKRLAKPLPSVPRSKNIKTHQKKTELWTLENGHLNEIIKFLEAFLSGLRWPPVKTWRQVLCCSPTATSGGERPWISCRLRLTPTSRWRRSASRISSTSRRWRSRSPVSAHRGCWRKWRAPTPPGTGSPLPRRRCARWRSWPARHSRVWKSAWSRQQKVTTLRFECRFIQFNCGENSWEKLGQMDKAAKSSKKNCELSKSLTLSSAPGSFWTCKNPDGILKIRAGPWTVIIRKMTPHVC